MTETRSAEEMAEVDRRRAERFADRDVRCLLSLENFPVIAERIQRMLPVGRRFSLVQEWLGEQAGGTPEIVASTRRDARSRGEGLHVWGGGMTPTQAGLSVSTEQSLMGFGIGTTWAHERDVHAELRRLHEHALETGFPRGKPKSEHYDRRGVGAQTCRGVTYVEMVGGVEGAYKGHGDHLTIIYTNENGVSRRTIVIPQYEPPEETAQRERAVLDRAAAILDATDWGWNRLAAEILRDVGARNLYHGRTLAEWAGPVDDEAKCDAERWREHEASAARRDRP